MMLRYAFFFSEAGRPRSQAQDFTDVVQTWFLRCLFV